jgi:ABC-type sugar transport system ATPase subunit
MTTLELQSLRKTFSDGTVAVDDVSLRIDDGEFLAIVGPSGCGKTTVLRMVAGLEQATTGDVLIDGVRVNDLSPRERDIAMAFQQNALYPNMTVRENIGFPLRISGSHKREWRRRADDIALVLGLGDVLDNTPRQLSGGQQQRAAMGRALIRDPRLLLMDEPMSNLDAKLRGTTRVEILKIHNRMKVTTMYVTHDQIEAMSMADRVVVMRSGRIVQTGTPIELYRNPRDVFVAQFIGSPPMSIVIATVTDDGVAIGPFRVPMPVRPARPGTRLALGLRPNAFVRDVDGTVLASVVDCERLGPEQLVHATIDCPGITHVGSDAVNTTSLRSPIAIFVGTDERIDLWQPLRLTIDPQEVHFFDLASGEALDPIGGFRGCHAPDGISTRSVDVR